MFDSAKKQPFWEHDAGFDLFMFVYLTEKHQNLLKMQLKILSICNQIVSVCCLSNDVYNTEVQLGQNNKLHKYGEN